MNIFLGLFGFSVSTLVIILLSYRRPELSRVLLIAFTLRILFIIINNYIFVLPDGAFDAVKYERYGWEWSVNDEVFFEKFVGPSTFFYSWVIGVIYEITDRSVLLIQFISVIVSILLIYTSWHLTKLLFSVKEAKVVAWVLALHPVVLMYSVLTMKEIFISFFFVYSVYHFITWYIQPNMNTKSLLKAFTFSVVAIFFHGAMAILLGMFVFFYVYVKNRERVALSQISSALALILATTFVIIFWHYDIALPKLGTIESALDPYRWMSEMNHRTIGVTAYPEFLVAKDSIDLLWIVPVRLFYFIFSPFIWDVSSISHLFGVADGLSYMYLSFYIVKYRMGIFKVKGAGIIFIFIFVFIFIFSIGTGNSGTAVRHRFKFLPLIMVLFSRAFLLSKANKRA